MGYEKLVDGDNSDIITICSHLAGSDDMVESGGQHITPVVMSPDA